MATRYPSSLNKVKRRSTLAVGIHVGESAKDSAMRASACVGTAFREPIWTRTGRLETTHPPTSFYAPVAQPGQSTRLISEGSMVQIHSDAPIFNIPDA